MLSPSLQICCQGPLAAACGTGRRPRHSCGADLLANPDAAAGWRRGMVASGHPAAAPSPPPPAQRQRQRSCGAYLLRGCADAAAGRLRCTVASGPPGPGRPPTPRAAYHDLLYGAAARTLLLGGPTGGPAPP